MSSNEVVYFAFPKMTLHYLRLNARESLRDKSRISAREELLEITKSVTFPLPTSQQSSAADASVDSGTCTSTEDIVSNI